MFQEVMVVCISGAFVFGLILVMLTSLRPAIAKRLGWPEGKVDWLVASFNLALIPMMLLSGVAADHVGAQLTTVVGSLVSAVALFLLGRSDTYLRAQAAILLLGAGGSFLSTASTVTMLKAFFPESEP